MAQFADPTPLDYDEDTRIAIANMVKQTYDDGVTARREWNSQHELYDQMFRGALPQRIGPWPGASDLHVQMPYWLVDSVNVRLVASIWNQVPLVAGSWEDDDDEELVKKAAKEVEWNLQPKRMNGRSNWSRASKTRLIHGCAVLELFYAKDEGKYFLEETSAPTPRFNEDGTPMVDEEGEPMMVESDTKKVPTDLTYYDGPGMAPLAWDDTIVPIGATNLQPIRMKNPGGSDNVIIRKYDRLSTLWKKRDGAYYAIEEDKQWWIDHAPDQTRSGISDNQSEARTQDAFEGVNRSQAVNRTNPEFEVLTYYGPYEDPDTGDDEEMVIFVSLNPLQFLGAFRLNEMFFNGLRPLVELHYQTVSNRFYSMGIMEIVKHLSAELDTIHNLRMDVGQATNLPFFFYKAATGFTPEDIQLVPLKGVPVESTSDVYFPQMQNVTSFYSAEENMLYTLVERVVGVTDLFLGISPTSGAAARTATGFVGTQQEALARTSEILNQDADSFAFACQFIYDLEIQYGPDERRFRLHGEDTPTNIELTIEQMLDRNRYDLRLGSNQGAFSQMVQQQQAQAVMQTIQSNPFLPQEMGRMWEVFNRYYQSIGLTEQEIVSIQGPKEAVSQGTPQAQDEEIGEMIQFKYGLGIPAPVHPSDPDDKHTEFILKFLQEYPNAPNKSAIVQHLQLHEQQKQRKQQQAAMAQAQAQNSAPGPGQPPQNGSQDRMMAGMLKQPGGMEGLPESPPQNGSSVPNQSAIPMNTGGQ